MTEKPKNTRQRRAKTRTLAPIVLTDDQAGQELQWLRDRLVAQALSQHSINAYLQDLKQLVVWRNKALSQLDKSDFDEYLRFLAGDGRNPRSVARCLSAARHFYR
ncbi:MAG TPA: site-specific integrase, partial [Agitococcus sp.]|nr:site-specific integrase [Agitococcus sp.]